MAPIRRRSNRTSSPSRVRGALIRTVQARARLHPLVRARIGSTPALAEFVELESQCCAFLDFEIRLDAGAEEVTLSLTGPDGTKEVLGSLIGD